MNKRIVPNLITSFDRIPVLKKQEQPQDTGGLLRKRVSSEQTTKAEYVPLVSAVKSYQEIKQARMEVLESRKNV